MEKIYHSRTNISEDVLLLMARVSMLTKQLNGLTLTDQAKKQEIIKELFGSVGTNPFVGDNFHCDFGKNNGNAVGGLILQIDQQSAKGELEILFIHPEAHRKGIGQAAWKAVEEMHPEIRVWETMTPYFEKRNIHFYVNRLGFHIVEFWNKYQHGPAVPEDLEEDDGEHQSSWSEDDEMFRFQKIM